MEFVYSNIYASRLVSVFSDQAKIYRTEYLFNNTQVLDLNIGENMDGNVGYPQHLWGIR
jgi:hypothetical protein